jgi:hypothetical protein
VSSSSQMNSVCRLPTARSSKRPLPVTVPTCETPIAALGTHSVISIRSVRRSGPILVSQSNVVPTPLVDAEVNRIASASAIQSTCDAMSWT